MSNLLVIGFVVVAVVSGNPIPACLSDETIVSKCISDNGISMADFTNVENGTVFDEQVIKHLCAIFPQYLKAHTCIVTEFNRCSLEDNTISVSVINLITQELDVLCNDTSINFHCLAQSQQQTAQIQACVEPQISSIASSSHTPQENTCLSMKIGFQCLVDLVTKCDTHTGSVVDKLSKISSAYVCNDSVIG